MSQPTSHAGASITEPATIGVRVEAPADQPADHPSGWWLVTDTGARAFAPASSLVGFRLLRPGQRVQVTWRPGAYPGADPVVERLEPPFAIR